MCLLSRKIIIRIFKEDTIQFTNANACISLLTHCVFSDLFSVRLTVMVLWCRLASFKPGEALISHPSVCNCFLNDCQTLIECFALCHLKLAAASASSVSQSSCNTRNFCLSVVSQCVATICIAINWNKMRSFFLTP